VVDDRGGEPVDAPGGLLAGDDLRADDPVGGFVREDLDGHGGAAGVVPGAGEPLGLPDDDVEAVPGREAQREAGAGDLPVGDDADPWAGDGPEEELLLACGVVAGDAALLDRGGAELAHGGPGHDRGLALHQVPGDVDVGHQAAPPVGLEGGGDCERPQLAYVVSEGLGEVQVGADAGGEDHHLAGVLLAVGGDALDLALSVDGLDGGLHDELDAHGLQVLLDDVGHVLVRDAGDDLGHHLDDSDVLAHVVEGYGELEADDARSADDDLVGALEGGLDGLAVPDGPDDEHVAEVGARYGGHEHPSAGGDDERVVGVLLSCGNDGLLLLVHGLDPGLREDLYAPLLLVEGGVVHDDVLPAALPFDGEGDGAGRVGDVGVLSEDGDLRLRALGFGGGRGGHARGARSDDNYLLGH